MTSARHRAALAASAAGGGTVRTAAGPYRVRPDRLVLGDKVAVTGSGTVLTAAEGQHPMWPTRRRETAARGPVSS